MKIERSRLAARVIGVSMALMSGCGSGGGGGGDNGSLASASTGVRILHAAIETAPLDVISSTTPQETVQTSRFAIPTIYSALSTGTQNLLITQSKTPSEVFFTQTLTVEKKEHRSLLVYGDHTTGLKLAVFDDAPGEVPGGKSLVRIVNGAIGAQDIAVKLGGKQVVSDITFGDASEYVAASPGEQIVVVTRISDSKVVFSGRKNIEAGKAYTFLVTGEVGYLVVVPRYED